MHHHASSCIFVHHLTAGDALAAERKLALAAAVVVVWCSGQPWLPSARRRPGAVCFGSLSVFAGALPHQTDSHQGACRLALPRRGGSARERTPPLLGSLVMVVVVVNCTINDGELHNKPAHAVPVASPRPDQNPKEILVVSMWLWVY